REDGLRSSTVRSVSLDVPVEWDDPIELAYTADVKYNLASTIKSRTLWIPSAPTWLPDPDKLSRPLHVSLQPLEARLTTTYDLPDGWSAQPPVDVTLTQPFALYRSRYAVDGRRVTIERVLEVSAGAIDEEGRAAYTAFRKAVLDDRGQRFGLTIPTAPPAPAETGDA